MKKYFAFILFTIFCNTALCGPLDELNYWRKRVGLPLFREDPIMTKFAQDKARYRALRDLRDNHLGHTPIPNGWIEGCGEATPSWGWLTCSMEDDHRFVGVGLVVNQTTGLRYMVLVGRGGTGRALINPNNIRTFNTSYLTPNPETVQSPRSKRIWCPNCRTYH